MNENGFRNWLIRTGDAATTVSTRMATVRRVESAYGDLDQAYSQDMFESILSDLGFSKADERRSESNPSRIAIDGNLYDGLASCRTHLRKYGAFLEQLSASPIPETVADQLEAEVENKASDVVFRYEKDLQSALISSISQIEPGLALAENGREYAVPSGRIDALAADSDGKPVVLELKAVTAKREFLGQIAAYMADIQDETGERPRGILIAPDFDGRLVSAARMVAGLKLLRYSFSFSFSEL